MSTQRNAISILPGAYQSKAIKQIEIAEVTENVGSLPKKDSKLSQSSTNSTKSNIGSKQTASSSAISQKKVAAPIGDVKIGPLAISTKTTTASRLPNRPAKPEKTPTQMEASLKDLKDLFNSTGKNCIVQNI